MAKAIKAGDLAAAIERELTIYSQEVTERVDDAGRAAMKQLVQKTKATAPTGERNSGKFKASITSKEVKGARGNEYIWYVKPPNHRLTHLLVHGHATKNGGRTKPHPFLKNALETVLPEYERAVEEAVKG